MICKTTAVAVMIALTLASGAVAGPIIQNGVTLDRHAMIDRSLIEAALSSFDAHRAKISNTRRIAIADISHFSASPRLYLLNLQDGSVMSMVTTHGLGSDPDHIGKAVRTSNSPGSNASSVGAFVTGEGIVSSNAPTGNDLPLSSPDAPQTQVRRPFPLVRFLA